MKLFLFIFVVSAVTVACLGQDDFEEDAPPPPSSSILARAKGRALPGKPQVASKNVLDSKLKKATPASSPPPPPPQNEDDLGEEIPEGEGEDGFVDENVEASSIKPTEPPKRLGQGARPFRSNQDLLETLKRRREQRVYVAPPSTSTSFTPVQIPEKQPKAPRSKYATSKGNFSPSQEQAFDNSKKSSNSRNFKNKPTQAPLPLEEEEDLEPTPAPKAAGRAFGGRSRRL